MLLKKKILILVEEKKSDSEFLSYNLMLNSGEKKNILTLVLSEKKISERNKKPRYSRCKRRWNNVLCMQDNQNMNTVSKNIKFLCIKTE